jgi:D-alanyl-lipoteichoic acid acyltransferase DltB (MBOAT superfamily)
LVASYLFYMSWNVACGGLIFFTSLVDFYVGKRLSKLESPRQRKWLLAASLVANLGVLGVFKYTNFMLDNAVACLSAIGVHVGRPYLDIILPAGISFFTFQSMSYTIDVYRRQISPCPSLRDFLLFVAFFPQLLAGPIVRAADLIPQLTQRIRASWADIEAGLAMFALGAVKKLVISDQVAPHVELIFADPAHYNALALLQGLLGYAVQIYCDFSGYSDMAIGSARMMGYRFPENFKMPYSAVTIAEFWRRWHISLSTWLRDYLYISLGGNRKGTGRTYVNLMLTMLLGGLWHGASWNFILWGGLHGVALAVHRAWQGVCPWRDRPLPGLLAGLWRAASQALTLGTVLVGWIFFRCEGLPKSWDFLTGILTGKTDGIPLTSPHILMALTGVSLAHLLISKHRNWCEEIPNASVTWRIATYTGLFLMIVTLGATDSAPFIYFQF